MPSGHKAFLVHNINDVDLLLMHNKTFAAEYVTPPHLSATIPSLSRTQFSNEEAQNRPRRLVAKKSGHHRQGKTIGRQGHQCQGQGDDGSMSLREGGIPSCDRRASSFLPVLPNLEKWRRLKESNSIKLCAHAVLHFAAVIRGPGSSCGKAETASSRHATLCHTSYHQPTPKK